MSEPTITINGVHLTEAQASTVRCAIEALASLIDRENLPSRNPERGKYPPKPPMPPDFERCIYIAMKELREDGKI